MIDALTAAARPRDDDAPVVLMVSGGSDSTALLVRAACDRVDLCDGRGLRRLPLHALHVLHVNHCLRGEASDADERFVRNLCADLGVACTVHRADVPGLLAAGGNLEDVARTVRYETAWRLMCELEDAAGFARGTARIAVAHTADDRAETFVMRAIAGAGASGLAGMRRQRGVVVRPLLDETRASLRAYLRSRGVGWCEDATNAEDAALRSYVRNRVIPTLTARNPAFSSTLAATLDVLADESDYLEERAFDELDRLVESAGPGRLILDAARLRSCHRAVARRAVRAALRRLLGDDAFVTARFEARHVADVLDLTARGAGSCTLPLKIDARIDRGHLVLALSDPCCDSRGLPTGLDEGRGVSPQRPDAAVLPVPGQAIWHGRTVVARVVEVPAFERGDNSCTWIRGLARRREAQGLTEGRDFVLVDAAAFAPFRAGSAGLAVCVGLPVDPVSPADPPAGPVAPAEAPAGPVAPADLPAGPVAPAEASADPVAPVAPMLRLEVGPPHAGERMRPFGMEGSKLVSDILREADVAVHLRADVPVVRGVYRSHGAASDGAVRPCCVWVGGIRLDARAAYGPFTQVLIELRVL